MIERIWSGKSKLYPLLLPLSLLYGLVSSLRRWGYRLGWLRSWRSPVPVVVVGNLTAGGNGKTPIVIWLVERLSQKGLRVGVVSRGYGGKAERYPVVLNKATTPNEAGDEPVLIFQRTGLPSPFLPFAVRPLRRCCRNMNWTLLLPMTGYSTTLYRETSSWWSLTAFAASATAGGYRPGPCESEPNGLRVSMQRSLTAVGRCREKSR